LQVSGNKDIKDAMFLMEVHARDPEESEKIQIENFAKVIPKFHAVRSIGNYRDSLMFNVNVYIEHRHLIY
jgi:hypothetical protein